MVIPHLMRDLSQRTCAAATPFLSVFIRSIRVLFKFPCQARDDGLKAGAARSSAVNDQC